MGELTFLNFGMTLIGSPLHLPITRVFLPLCSISYGHFPKYKSLYGWGIFFSNGFSKAVKNAISDLIRDNYLTEEAYKLKYDQDAYIIQYIKMWEQHFIASSLRLKLLESKPSNLQEIKYLNPIINKLFLKYSDKIKIDFEILDEINLTSIPMHIVNKNAAYHSPIPQFPILTDNYKINYGVRRK